jgi:serine/threonine-protein kinase
MAVDYTVKGDSFAVGQSREFTPHPTILTGITPPYAVFPDGKRVAMYLPETTNDTGSVHVTVLLNFFDEVRRRIP